MFKYKMPSKKTYSEVSDVFRSNNLTLIWSNEEFDELYIDNKTRNIPYICECGNQSVIEFQSARKGNNYELRVYNRKGERVFIETFCC